MTIAEALKIASHAVSPIWGSGASLTYSEPYDPATPDGPRTETQCGAYGYAQDGATTVAGIVRAAHRRLGSAV